MEMTKSETIFTSPPMPIGKHEWRIRQFICPRYGVSMTYEFRGPNAPSYYPADHWHDMTQWPSYNSDNGTTAGCPATLRKLWDRHRDEMQANKAAATRNTCQQAFAILASDPGATARTESDTARALIWLKRIAAPAGTISDGTRAFLIAPCERWRYLTVTLGSDLVAEVDQRNHHDDPAGMARAVLDAIEARAAAGRGERLNLAAENQGFRVELTASGEQTVIPGCERNLAPSVKQLDLFE